jgi:ABC-type multidrug transport system ATPase subunit
VGGQVINPVKFRKHIAYVMQDDALMATATPREALMFSANMRLPPTTDKKTLESLVDKLLDDLGLTECADVLIGGALIKGISGGQRKRTSVGVEVITDPAVSYNEVAASLQWLISTFAYISCATQLLFLDEPTSGLDSHSASNLVKLLKTIAMRNSAILCTIHQPSSEVFALFDIVIFMKAGRIFYQGPVSKINTHFADLDHPCPENYNPADFVMNLCQTLTGNELERVCMAIPEEVLAERGSSQQRGEEIIEFQVQSSFVKQMGQLAFREFTNVRRDTAALCVRFGVTILLNVLYGLIFLGAGGEDNGDTKNFNSHVGAVMMAMIYSMFGSAQPIMLAFPFERPMFLREYSTGTCKYAVVTPVL